MKLEDLWEAPQNTFPTEFGLDDEDFNKKFGRKLLNGPTTKTPIKKIGDDFTLWEFKREFAVIKNSNRYIAYYMKFRFDNVPVINRQCVRQVVVWRSAEPITQRMGREMFNDILLPRYQTVITDAEQTEDGKRFWKDRIADALADSSLKVYYLNIYTPKEIVEVKSFDEYTQIVQGKPAYGDESEYKNRRFIITRKPF